MGLVPIPTAVQPARRPLRRLERPARRKHPDPRTALPDSSEDFGGRPLEATVSAVNDADLQVTLSFGGATGNPTSIAIDDQTTYATAKKADKSAVTSGAHVYVTTSAATDGTLTATSVVVLPASAPSNSGQSTTGGSGVGEQGTGGVSSNGGRFGGGATNRPIDGTVASVSGQQLKITLANGSTSTVTLSDQTTYETTTFG